MTQIDAPKALRAYVPLPPKLSQILEKDLCKSKLLGKCSNSSCTKEHSIRIVSEAEGPVSQLLPQNTVSHAPRSALQNSKLFNNQSPQNSKTHKHDNDHTLIEDIDILPTTDEIICLDPVYMPKKNGASLASELLDIHFRQLRYDNVENIIDACYDGLQNAVWPENSARFRYETPRGVQYALLGDVKFEGIRFHQYAGAMFRLSFDCPINLRGFALFKSSLLDKDKMCSLLALHDTTQEVNIIHLEVKERQASDIRSTTGRKSRAFVQVCLANRNDIHKVRQAMLYAMRMIKARFFLVSHSNVLPVSFMPVLQRLQDCHKEGTFPFSDIIAPQHNLTKIDLPVPEYANRTGFNYNFNCLKEVGMDVAPEKLMFRPMPSGAHDPEVINNLKSYTTLDDGQAVALYENLSRCLAFTQGPPGTGKTFLGVAEAEVILKSRPQALSGQPPKPLVVICMTNHALDDFVDSLIKRGLDKVVRLGSRSTNEWMEKYQLRRVLAAKKMPSQEWHTMKKFGRDNDEIVNFACEWSEELNEGPAFRLLQDFLQLNEPGLLAEFQRLDGSADVITDLRYLKRSSAGYAFQYWLKGGDLDSLALLLNTGTSSPPSSLGENFKALSLSSNSTQGSSGTNSRTGQLPLGSHLSITNSPNQTKTGKDHTQVKETNNPGLPTLQRALEVFAKRSRTNSDTHKLWSLTLADRRSLLASWKAKLDKVTLCESFAEIHRRQQQLQSNRWKWIRNVDARVIQELGIQIVALTANGAARNWELLNALKPQTYIIEEASELTEPITIAGLVPSIQHLIKIGDPLQLRPHVSSQALTSERDPTYRLDESLFERLMKKVPYSKLNVQRRAHPNMANMLRAGDYPYLIDHPKTLLHPELPGFKHRMFWIDHDRIEDSPDPGSPLAKSFSNKYEVRFIREAIKYLVQRQGISMTRITILTPYNGQVALFVRALQGFCKVLLNDEDKKSLEESGLLPEEPLIPNPSGSTQVALDSLIRITTVDNYQGEENDIIFLSTVRSNTNNKVGFLANQNRINVAISRARNAFYIIGNSAFLSKNIDSWRDIVKVFKKGGWIGRQLPLSPCAKHNLMTDIAVDIQQTQNFELIPDCQAHCGAELVCGHQCDSECHAEEMHTDGRLKCLQQCSKTLQCGHPCKKLCYERCGPCQHPMERTLLDCGHKFNVQCSTDLASIQCKALVTPYKDAKCGHIRFILCSSGLSPCKEPCSKLRPCGHACKNLCYECEHKECDKVCGKLLDCGHTCQKVCHYGSEGPCPPCQQPCKKGCIHGPCRYKCSDLCNPCTKDGPATHCQHQDPAIFCSIPGSRLPCTQPCQLSAPCGAHQCQGLCGEECPEVCDACEGIPRREQLFSLPCRCIFKVQELDQKFELNKLYKMNESEILMVEVKSIPDKDLLKCPACSASVIGVRRYALLGQIHELNDLLGSLCSPLGRQLWRMMKFVNHGLYDMFNNFDKFCQKIKPGPLMVKNNQALVSNKLAGIREALLEVRRFRDVEVQSVQSAVSAFTAFLGISSDLSAGNCNSVGIIPLLGIPNLPYLLRSERVIVRCQSAIAKFLWDVYRYLRRQKGADNHLSLFQEVIRTEAISEVHGVLDKLDMLMIQAEAGNFKRLEVEFIIQKVLLVTLIRQMGVEIGQMLDLIKHGSNICKEVRSAGLLRRNLAEVERCILTFADTVEFDDSQDVPKRPDAEIQLLWKRLGIFERGTLVMCPLGHYRCSVNFTYCPECG